MRLTDLENRMRVATDLERYLKPSVVLYRRVLESGCDVNMVCPDQQNALFSVVALGDTEDGFCRT